MENFLVTISGDYLRLPEGFDYDVIFHDKTGRVQVFEKYMAVLNTKSRKLLGYSTIEDFWKNSKFNKSVRNFTTNSPTVNISNINFQSLITTVLSPLKGSRPNPGDKVILARREIIKITDGSYKINNIRRAFIYPKESDNPELYLEIKTKLDYTVLEGVDKSTHIITNDAFFARFPEGDVGEPVEENLTVLPGDYYKLGNFYQNVIKNGYISPASESALQLDSGEVNIIESITFLFHEIFKNEKFVTYLNFVNYQFIFDHFFAIFDRPLEDNIHIITSEEYYQSFNSEYFDLLYLRLHDFFFWVNAGMDFSEQILSRIFGLFDLVILKSIAYIDKIWLLENFLNGNAYLSGRWNPFLSQYKLTEEEVVIKLIESVKRKKEGVWNYEEINDFLHLLSSPLFYEKNANTSLFQHLYSQIHPDLMLGGAGAQGRFADAVYGLWIDSIYNPKATLIPGMLHFPYEYTEYNAMWRYDDFKEIDSKAAPMVLPYKSEKKWLWHFDNMNFYLNDNQIEAKLDGNLYGTYHIFQPINLLSIKDAETFVSIPIDANILKGNENPTPCDLESGRGSNLPVFYLKYVDDIGDKKDSEEALMITIDVLTTVMGGWGIARRLLAESTIRKLFVKAAEVGIVDAIEALTPLAKANLIQILKSVAIPSIEFVLGAASIAHSFIEGNCAIYNDCNNEPPAEGHSNYEKYQRCQAIQKWLFALEILTLSGDLVSRIFFKKATVDILDLPDNNDPMFIELRTRVRILQELFVVDVEAFLGRFSPDVRNLIGSFSDDKKLIFVYDYIFQKETIIEQLTGSNAETLINRWSALYEVKSIDRVKITVLNNENLVNGLVKFCGKQNINEFISKLDFKQRVRLIEKYNNEPFNFTLSELDKINGSPSRLKMMLSHMESPNINQIDKFDDLDIKIILNSDLPDIAVALQEIKISLPLKTAKYRYLKRIQNLQMDLNELDNMYRGNIENFIVLSSAIKKDIKIHNKYVTTVKILNGNVLVEVINGYFISGRLDGLIKKFRGSFPIWITNPVDEGLFNIFTLKAFDLNKRDRFFDTELKFIFDLLINHWHKGNRFKIEVKSTLYTCTSCRGYWVYLEELARQQGKTIDIVVIADKNFESIADVQAKLGKF